MGGLSGVVLLRIYLGDGAKASFFFSIAFVYRCVSTYKWVVSSGTSELY